LAYSDDVTIDQLQQAPRLRRQFIEAAAEYVVDDAIR